ncbi:MAG: zinc-binding alcohol dehydrogenase [Candidatus Poribacteria bacterium]|nr:zinc-binding alcohol dehydrogenase [Candidatus Poribacteria bacterium]
MRAIVTRLKSDGIREKVLVDDWQDPGAPAANEVRTHTLYSGITNGTERNDLLGGNYASADHELPAIGGYQNVGEVVEVGTGVQDLEFGDLLYMSQSHREFCLEPENRLHIKLPAEIKPAEAALFGVAGVAMRCCRNADLRIGDRMLVVGAGIVGQLAAQIAACTGACVTLCDINDHRLEIAKSIGAVDEVINVAGDGWDKHIHDFGFDVVLDAAGVPDMEDKLIAAAKKHGTVMFIAGRFRVEYTFNRGQGREITIKQNSHFDNSDLRHMCRFALKGMIQIAPLIQDVVPVDKAQGIYETLRDEPQKLFGTVFDWR